MERGLSANAVLVPAIQTEKFFADAVGAGKKVLIEHPNGRMERVIFHQMSPRRAA